MKTKEQILASIEGIIPPDVEPGEKTAILEAVGVLCDIRYSMAVIAEKMSKRAPSSPRSAACARMASTSHPSADPTATD